MRIDQPRQDNLPTQIEDRIRGFRRHGCRVDLLDDSIDRKIPSSVGGGVRLRPNRGFPRQPAT